MISCYFVRAAALLFVSLLGVGVVPAVNSGQEIDAFPFVSELPGWPVLTLGDTIFSPPMLVRSDGSHFLLHNRFGVMGKRPGARAPTLVGRDPEGVILPGWTPLLKGIPFDGVSVWLDGDRHVRRVFGGGGRIHGFQADGTRASGWPQPRGVLPFLEPPSLMDMDGDGTPEVLGVTRDGDLFIWRQDGSLFPGWPQRVPPLQTEEALSVTVPPAGADLDGDGLPELVVMGFGGFLGVYDRYGRSLPGWPKDLSVGQNLSDGYAIVPLGDGTRGIGMGTSGGLDDHVFLYDFAGRLVPGWPQPSPHLVRSVSAGDLDGDNVPELLFAAEALTLGFHLDGTVMKGWPLDSRNSALQGEPMIVDLTDDGRPEVVTFHSSSSWFVTGWRADTTLIQAVQISGVFELGSQSPSFGDLDGDGMLDMTLAARSGFLNAPGKVHVYGFNVPVNEAGMQWPTPAHDYARTSTWEPPTRHLEGTGSTAPGSLMPGDPAPKLTLFLKIPEAAPVAAGLAVTALAGVSIRPIPVEIRPRSRLSGPSLSGKQLTRGRRGEAGRPSRGRQSLNGPSSRRPQPADLSGHRAQTLVAQVEGQAILDAFALVSETHPELLLTDDETRSWLATGIVPVLADDETRTLWLTLETPRVGVDKLTAHLPVGIGRGPFEPHR